MSGIKNIALNFLSAEKGFKAGVKRKQKKAALNESYASQILTSLLLHKFVLRYCFFFTLFSINAKSIFSFGGLINETFFSTIFFVGFSYGNENYKYISFKGAVLSIPSKWNAKEESDCLNINDPNARGTGGLIICKYMSREDGYYFVKNEEGEWEAMTEGVSILADINVISKFTGLSAVVACRYKDDAGYHLDQCFQAEIFLPKNTGFIFIGKGEPNFFNTYKKVYLSFSEK